MDLIFSTYFLHLATYLYYEGEKLDYGTNSKFLTILTDSFSNTLI